LAYYPITIKHFQGILGIHIKNPEYAETICTSTTSDDFGGTVYRKSQMGDYKLGRTTSNLNFLVVPLKKLLFAYMENRLNGKKEFKLGISRLIIDHQKKNC
jgi:hypothetical protein